MILSRNKPNRAVFALVMSLAAITIACTVPAASAATPGVSGGAAVEDGSTGWAPASDTTATQEALTGDTERSRPYDTTALRTGLVLLGLSLLALGFGLVGLSRQRRGTQAIRGEHRGMWLRLPNRGQTRAHL
jgi:hypothetical protein